MVWRGRAFAETARTRRAATLLSALLALGGVCGRGIAQAAPAVGVPWVELRLSAHKFFLSAATSLRIEQVAASTLASRLRTPPDGSPAALTGPDAVVLTSETDLPFGRNETVTVWLDPATDAAIQAEKLAGSRNPYRKVFRYTEHGEYTWRSEPADSREASGDPSAWTRGSESFEQSPATSPPGLPITESYALLYLASAARLDQPDARLRLAILSDARLIELAFTPDGLVRKRVSFEEAWPGGARRRSGELLLRKVRVTARPLDTAGGGADVDLGFLGMRGDLTILVEAGTGIPVELSGHAEHIGALTVRLDRVTLRQAPAAEGAD